MSDTFSVVFAGRLREGESREEVQSRLASLLKVEKDVLEDLFEGGPKILKRRADEITARKWATIIEQTGALCWVEPDSGQPPPRVAVHPAPAKTTDASPSPPVQEPAPPPAAPAAFQLMGSEIIGFTRCPKCGRLAETTDDELMVGGECPSCGLITAKYAKSWLLFPTDQRERSWMLFWQNPGWSAYYCGALVVSLLATSIPALMYIFGREAIEGDLASTTGLAVSGLLLGGLVFLLSIAGFHSYVLYRKRERIFRICLACSIGLVGVLALFGSLLCLFFGTVATVTRLIWIDRLLAPRSAVTLSAVLFVAVTLYLALVRFPAEDALVEFLQDGEYSQEVKTARALAGQGFPAGSQTLRYQYFKFVYLRPTEPLQPDFERTIRRLVRDFNVGGLKESYPADVSLLLELAATFRTELADEGLISDQTRSRLAPFAPKAKGRRDKAAR